MKHIVLLGDSIFDNASYVDAGESVAERLTGLVSQVDQVTLLAVDGGVTTDVFGQLKKFPAGATHVVVSCGGNDALRVADILNKPVSSIGEGLDELRRILDQFRSNYCAMLNAIVRLNAQLTVCTIYNHVPEVTERALTALALFNEILLEEAAALKLPVIDLRLVCRDFEDYSSISPIEPSGQGSIKIAKKIHHVLSVHDFQSGECRLYV
ncbi:SGNH/GDSL hydrolase family protein [Hahella ganghwensis]|uniref:SGNH/GDSL hydrolase family protein n=1 Tax=Hahella ganghwensis TaxID=286420 RepID=UPI0003633E06|nr:SGNH/GDSL hydrolase family protein [Hahella ganghwensis]